MSQNLSYFHAELLEYMLCSIAEKIKIDGFDVATDPELQTLQKSINDALAPVSDQPLPFSEIVEKYQYLFDFRGPLHLDKHLIRVFSQKESKDHSMQIYRGLPRVHRQDRPAKSRLKHHFTKLSTLKRLAAEKAIFQLYSEIEPPETAKVSLFSWIIGDGWGDYIAGLESIEILQRRFPHLQLGWVVLFPKRLGSPPVPKGLKTHLISYDQECPVSLIQTEGLEILRTSDLVIQIPTFYPFFEELKVAVNSIPFSSDPPNWVSIGEYGFLESKWFHPQTGNRSMGLHFLEKGVIIPTRGPSVSNFSLLANHELLHWLFNTSTPGPREIEHYQQEHSFYLAYLTTPIGGAVYLHALIKAHELDKKSIDICSPDIGWLIRYIQMQTEAGQPILRAEGIGLELYYQGKVVLLVEQAKGKKIRIFAPSSTTPEDFHSLACISGEFTAVRGDQSFSEIVSINKGFFYDGRDHARYFFKDLLALAENRIRGHRSTLEVLRGMYKTFLHNLPLGQAEWVDESDFQEREPWIEIAAKIGTALQDPDCIAGFKKLNWIIAKEHAFNDFFCHLIQRELCHRISPEAARVEEQSMRPFVEGQISLPAAIEDLRNRLRDGK